MDYMSASKRILNKFIFNDIGEGIIKLNTDNEYRAWKLQISSLGNIPVLAINIENKGTYLISIESILTDIINHIKLQESIKDEKNQSMHDSQERSEDN